MDVAIGFLGTGNIAGLHARLLARPGVGARIVACHDPDPDRAASFAARWGGRALDDPMAVVAAADAVYVCTWTSEHLPLAELVVSEGRALFCEKPLGRDLAEATRLARVVQRAGVVEQVGLVLRRSPAFNVLRAFVQDDATGPIQGVTYRDDQYLPVQGRYASTWRADVERAGAGVLLEHSIHDVDLLEWMFGPVVQITATTAEHHGIDGIEDAVSALFRFAAGTSVVFTSVWHDLLERPSQRCVEVLGQRRVIRLEGEWTGTVTAEDATGTTVLAGVELSSRAREVAVGVGNPDRAFVEAVRTGRSAGPSVSDALRAHVVVDAAYRSAREGGTPVPVPPIVDSDRART